MVAVAVFIVVTAGGGKVVDARVWWVLLLAMVDAEDERQ